MTVAPTFLWLLFLSSFLLSLSPFLFSSFLSTVFVVVVVVVFATWVPSVSVLIIAQGAFIIQIVGHWARHMSITNVYACSW